MMVIRTLKVALVLTAAVAAVSCDRSPVEPIPSTYPSVELRSLWIEGGFQGPLSRNSGVLVVMAEPADSTVRLGEGERLRLALTTSRGDAETLEFWRHLCNLHEVCSSLSILMKPGRRALEVQGVLARVPARFQIVSFSGSFGSARVFDPNRVEPALGLLQLHFGVQSVQRDVIGWSQGSGPAPRLNLVLASAPVDAMLPTPNDGTVQAVQGDKIHLKYTQPSGALLEFVAVVP